MERWDAWVRAYISVGDLLQTINFLPSGGNAFQVLSGASLIAEISRPQPATFEKQLPLVLSWAELRDERAVEILSQIDPQYAFWSSIVFLSPERTRRTMELINMVLQLCVYVEMRFKQAMGCFRPIEFNAQVQPMITTPGHGTFPMGHASQAYAVAYVLKQLLNLDPYPLVKDQLDRQAARIATNRIIAGMHFPVDAMAGLMLGIALGEYFVGRCLGGGLTFMGRKFLAAGIDAAPTTDFNPFDANQNPYNAGSTLYSYAAGAPITQSPLMCHAWCEAKKEWEHRFP
jgi:hypothetical protein